MYNIRLQAPKLARKCEIKHWYAGAGVCYVITKFTRMDSLPNFVTHGAPLRTRESSAITCFFSKWRASRTGGEDTIT